MELDSISLNAQLPTELLRQITFDYASTIREDCDNGEISRQNCKPLWHFFEPLTLASRTMQQLTFEAWFEVYYAESPDDLLDVWPEFSSWTRELHCVELGSNLQVLPLPLQWNLAAFHRLRKLRIDLNPKQWNSMLLLRFDYPRNIASSLQELEVHDISWPSPMTMSMIAKAFPGLRILRMSHDLVWCHLCNICRFATFRDHPPSSIVYENVLGLPTHYATFLKPLVNLQNVVLTVAYELGGKILLSKNDDIIWSGECDACMDMMFEEFHDIWPEKKRMLERPPSLTSVKWQFRHKQLWEVFDDANLSDEDEGEEETVSGITSLEDRLDAGELTVTSSDS